MSLKAAFERAGYKGGSESWPSDELLQAGINAMVRHADDADAAQHAIFRACCQLVLPWWRQATSSLIGEVRREIRRREQAGELATAAERKAARVISLDHERGLASEKQKREDELAANAKADKEYREYLKQWTETKARDFTINGAPFWQVSTRQAHAWQRRTGHEVRFVELLLAGVPTDDRPISHYRRPNEVNALWDQSFA